MDISNLNSFLKFGYFLDYKNPRVKFDFSRIDKQKYSDVSEYELIDIANKLWNSTVEKQFDRNQKHVVPLSGGLDSRGILSTLLKFTASSNIQTYTFGTPGTYDYEIGKLVAKKAGTKHHSFDLTKYKYTQNELVRISQRTDNQTLLFLHAPIKETDSLFSEYNVWSGAIIDVFFGRHTHKLEASDLSNAIKNSFTENIHVTSTNLNNVRDENYYQFIDFDNKLEKIHSYEHIIDLLNRQLKFIEPHVLLKGYNYKTLLSDELVDFAISIDNKHLNNQSLYKKMFLRHHSYLFSFPTKNSFGLPLSASNVSKLFKRGLDFLDKSVNNIINSSRSFNRNINYIDFEEAIRERKDVNKIVYENIMDLKDRKITDWINIDEIYNDHMKRRRNHADALMALSSLEIHLKAGKKL